jgi:transcriptional regulator with XRE-family HTH domain
MTFGARLAELRKLKRLTQDQLGKGLGTDGKDVGKAVVYGWEKDQHSPRADQLAMICERLGTSADYLLFGRVAEASLLPEVSRLASDINQLPSGQRELVLMTVRNAVALAGSVMPEADVVGRQRANYR